MTTTFKRAQRSSAEWFVAATILFTPSGAWAEPSVEFDFPKLVACRDVTPAEFAERNPEEKIVEAVFPISVRIRGNDDNQVQEVSIEIDAASGGLRVERFAPQTHLATEHAASVKLKTTTVNVGSIDATLGGALPVPYAEAVAKVTPSISAAKSKGKVATETTLRLPPMQSIVVSGTRNQGQGVFFELKPSTQTTLEGIHALTVSFVVPRKWQASPVRITCQARGERKVLWLDQDRVWGGSRREVGLYLIGDAEARELADVALSANAEKRAESFTHVLFLRPKPMVAAKWPTDDNETAPN